MRRLSDSKTDSRRRHRASQFKRRAFQTVSIAAITALFAGGMVAAQAAPGDISQGRAQFLGSNLLGLDLATVGTVNSGNISAPSPAANPLNLSALELLNLQLQLIGDGLELPLITDGSTPGLLDLGQLGALQNFASSDAATHSMSASGAVSDDGTVAVSKNATPSDFGNATVRLTDLLGQLGVSGLTSTVIDELSLEVGALATRAEWTRGSSVQSDYRVTDLKLDVHSALVAGVTAQLRTAVGGVSSSLSTKLNGLVGTNGAVTNVLDAVPPLSVPLLADVTLGDPTIAVNVSDLGAVIDTVLGAGTVLVSDDESVSINLVPGADQGTITVNLAKLVNPGGPNLNDLAPNTSVLTAGTIAKITAGITNALSKITGTVTAALEQALAQSTVTISIPVKASLLASLGSTLTVIDAPVTIGGTLRQIIDGDAVVDTTQLQLLPGLPNCLVSVAVTCAVPLSALDGLAASVQSTVTTNVIDPLLTALGPAVSDILTATNTELADTLNGVVSGVLTTLNPVLDGVLSKVAVIRINEQPTLLVPAQPADLGPDSFTVRAVGITLLPNIAGSSLAKIDLASSSAVVGDAVVLPVPTVTSISPNSGPEAGGTVVTVRGTNLTGLTGATFGTAAGTELTVVDATTATVKSPAGTGVVDVGVTSAGGTATLTSAFTYIPAAAAPLSLNPTHGPSRGGTPVTITGSNFLPGDVVVVDGLETVTPTSVQPTAIVFTTPAHVPGGVTVTVKRASVVSSPLPYIYDPSIAIGSVVPGSGLVAGGNTVTITGSCFTAATGVRFGATPATSFTVINDTMITAVVPAGVAGSVDVTVIGAPTCGTATLPNGYEYIGVPDATGILPAQGTELGGTVVEITGTHFIGASAVTFDGVPAAAFAVNSATSISATTPVHAPGVIDVVVTTPGGVSAPLDFEFTPQAVTPGTAVDAIDPASGPEAGGNTVSITGSCFSGATDVQFGGVSATSFAVISDLEISAVVPAGTPGTVDVTVVGSVTCGSASLPDGYEYIAAAVALSLSPTHGPSTGGTPVTIAGSGFAVGDTVEIDGVSVTPSSITATEIVFTTPAHAPGLVGVVVNGAGGSSSPLDYTFDVARTIGSVNPSEGPEAGGNTVTITGSCFTGATGVLFNIVPATSFTVVNDTTITAVVPAGTPGTASITVLGAPTCGTATLADAYEYIAAPVLSSIAPSSGPETGGTLVTLTGTGFAGASSVTVDGASVAFTVVNGTTITIVTPAHAPGAVAVVVTTPGGTSAPQTYTYIKVGSTKPAPVVSGLQPNSGPEAGGTVVTITGTGFSNASAVTFDGLTGTSLRVNSDTQITVASPAHAAATVDVIVTVPDAVAPSNAGRFTYLANAVVTPTPTPTPTPPATTTPSANPSAPPTPGAPGSSAKPGGIATTGVDGVGGEMFAAVLLMFAGTMLLVMRRRRAE